MLKCHENVCIPVDVKINSLDDLSNKIIKKENIMNKHIIKEWLNNINDEFAYWFTGIVDGEGHLSIRSNKTAGINPVGHYRCRLIIGLREDSRDAIMRIKDNLKIGKVHRRGVSGSSNPMAEFYVSAIDELLMLVGFFEKYPLYVKGEEFEIWKLAAREQSKPIQLRSLNLMKELQTQIRNKRKFHPADLDEPKITQLELSMVS